MAAGRRHGLPGWSRSTPGAGDLNGFKAAAAATTNGSALLVADLPLASATGLERVLAVATAPVAVVPSHDGGGTNVLAWRDPASFAPSFGPASAARHLAVPGAVRVDEPGLALDVDTADDLRRVAGPPRPGLGDRPPAQGPSLCSRAD